MKDFLKVLIAISVLTGGLYLMTIISNDNHINKELYSDIDFYIQELNTRIESYGTFTQYEERYTTDNQFRIKPIGRLINVKVLKPVDNDFYEDLKNDLKKHYKNNLKVNDVFINGGGTIMIDCRN